MTGKKNKAVFLIHGSWMGGWCWDEVAALLARTGSEVFSPSLVGIGEDPAARLATHVAQVQAHLDSISADDIVVVGHSYGAAVACEVAALGDRRIARLVILDGFLLEEGTSIFDRYPAVENLLQPLMESGPPGFIAPPPRALLESPAERLSDAVMDRLKPMPVATHRELARFPAAAINNPAHYVRFARFPAFAETETEARRLSWAVSRLEAGHMAMLTAPAAVCEKILEEV